MFTLVAKRTPKCDCLENDKEPERLRTSRESPRPPIPPLAEHESPSEGWRPSSTKVASRLSQSGLSRASLPRRSPGDVRREKNAAAGAT